MGRKRGEVESLMGNHLVQKTWQLGPESDSRVRIIWRPGALCR